MKRKVLGFIAACGIGTMLSAPAYCEGMEFIYNDTVINVDAKIINDRTMINIDSLESLGILAESADGIWEFEKSGAKLSYDEKKDAILVDGMELETDVKPVLISDEKLVPLRTTAENLGMLVGWDEYEEKVVLVDFNSYLEGLKQEHPDLYKLLNVQVKKINNGTSKAKIGMNIEVPDDEVSKVKLDLLVEGAAKEDMTKGGLVLEELSVEGERFGVYSLSDVTFDAVYDVDTMTAYFKTNIINKIKDSMPEEYRQEMASISELLDENMWYKFSYKEYFENMLAQMQDDEYLRAEISDMFKKIEDYNKNGININDIINQMVEDGIYIDDVYAFESVKLAIDMCTLLIDNKLVELEFDGDNLKSIRIDVDKNKLKDFLLNVYTPAIGYDADDAEYEFDEYFFEYDFGLKLLMEFTDGASTNSQIKLLMKAEDVTFELSLDESVDLNTVPEDIAIPETAIDIMTLLDMMVPKETV